MASHVVFDSGVFSRQKELEEESKFDFIAFSLHATQQMSDVSMKLNQQVLDLIEFFC